ALTAAIERSARFGSPLVDELHRQTRRLREEQGRRIAERAARAAPKIQLVIALVLVPSVLLLVAAALVANADRLLAYWGRRRRLELCAQTARDVGRGLAHRVQLFGALLVALEIEAEEAVCDLEGDPFRCHLGQPDDEGGGEEPAQPDLVLVGM